MTATSSLLICLTFSFIFDILILRSIITHRSWNNKFFVTITLLWLSWKWFSLLISMKPSHQVRFKSRTLAAYLRFFWNTITWNVKLPYMFLFGMRTIHFNNIFLYWRKLWRSNKQQVKINSWRGFPLIKLICAH